MQSTEPVSFLPLTTICRDVYGASIGDVTVTVAQWCVARRAAVVGLERANAERAAYNEHRARIGMLHIDPVEYIIEG